VFDTVPYGPPAAARRSMKLGFGQSISQLTQIRFYRGCRPPALRHIEPACYYFHPLVDAQNSGGNYH